MVEVQSQAARELEQLTRGFWKSRILMAGVELGLFEALDGRPATAEDLAARTGLDRRAVRILLGALAALGLLHHKQRVFELDPEMREYLVVAGAHSQVAILMHMRHMWDAWGRIDEVARTGHPAPRREEGPAELARIESFIRGMHEVSRDLVAAFAGREEVAAARRMLDLGGGPGSYAIACCRQNPELRATILDRELPLRIARENVAAAGLEDRITLQPGDALADGYGSGFDLVLISQLLHAFGPQECAAIIARAASALAPGGLLVVNEFALRDDPADPPMAALFAVNMLANTEGGSSYEIREISDWLHAAGLGAIRHEDIGGRSTLVIGRKG